MLDLVHFLIDIVWELWPLFLLALVIAGLSMCMLTGSAEGAMLLDEPPTVAEAAGFEFMVCVIIGLLFSAVVIGCLYAIIPKSE